MYLYNYHKELQRIQRLAKTVYELSKKLNLFYKIAHEKN